ncbi:MAG TPA: sodium:proton antiporter, partial [Phycisphaerales bacterium]|nr:sodium:proton antiporter [Phycisphaerales bacterium]
MGDAVSAHAEGHPGRLQGPVVWVVSVAVGLLLGVGLGRMLPARHAEDGAGHERSAVFETRSDGSVSRILADGRSVPAEVPEPGQAAPEPAAAEPAGHTGREGDGGHGSEPEIPLWLVAPFVLLLASIALMPFVSARFWHRHYPDVAFLLGAAVLGYYVTAFGAHGRH